MKTIIFELSAFMSTLFFSWLTLQLEIVALRHQFTVYQRTTQCPRINLGDRILWFWFSRRWSGWRGALVFVQTRTVLAWQHKRFRDHWTKLSKHGRPGRPPVSKEIRALIRKVSAANVGQFNAVNALAVCSISTIERLLESARLVYCTILETRLFWVRIYYAWV